MSENNENTEEIQEKSEETIKNEEESVINTEVPSIDSNPNKKKKNIVLYILIGVFLFLAVTITTVLIVLLTPKKTNEDIAEVEQKKIIEEYGKKLESLIDSYYQENGVLLTYEDAQKMIDNGYLIECNEHKIYDDGKIYLGICSIDKKEVPYTYGELRESDIEKLEYRDDNVKIYVSKTDHKATLDEPSNVDEYKVYSFNIEERYNNLELLGEYSDYVFYHTGDGMNHMINYVTMEEVKPTSDTIMVIPIIVNHKYDQQYVSFYDYVDNYSKYGTSYIKTKAGFYDLKNKKITVEPKFTSNIDVNLSMIFDFKALDESKAMIKGDKGYGVINYKTDKEIIPFIYDTVAEFEGYLLFGKYSSFEKHIFDFNGNEILKDKYSKIFVMYSEEYILVEQDDDVKLVDINGYEYYNFGKATITSNYNSFIDGDIIYFQFNIDYINGQTYCSELSYNAISQEGKVENDVKYKPRGH